MIFSHRGGSAGFTLIELLVGMSVGILLVVVLFQIFGVAADAWLRGENQVDAYREARAAMQIMTSDLSSISPQFPANPAASPVPLPQDPGIAPTLVLDKYPQPDPAREDGDANNEEVYGLATIANNGASSLCAVGYFCQWLPDVASDAARAPQAYALFRQFLGSGQSSAPGLYELIKNAHRSPLDFMDVFVRSRPGRAAPANAVAAAPSELASYVWDLQFRIDTNLNARRGAASQPPSDHNDILNPGAVKRFYAAEAGKEHPVELPSLIEIRFKAVSANGARQLEGNGSVTRATWWPASISNAAPLYKKVILPSTQQFVARVPLRSARLIVAPTR